MISWCDLSCPAHRYISKILNAMSLLQEAVHQNKESFLVMLEPYLHEFLILYSLREILNRFLAEFLSRDSKINHGVTKSWRIFHQLRNAFLLSSL